MIFNMDNIEDQKGRIGIVTGANSGLGLEVTKKLTSKGMKVIMACRNKGRAEKAKSLILKENPKADIQVMMLDVSKFNSVRKFADDFKTKYKRLDVLINNAGIMFTPYNVTVDGIESQFQTNYLGHFLLTSLLIDVMVDSDKSRIVSISSIAHKGGKINFDDLFWEKKYDRYGAYCQSKLACLMFSIELNDRLKEAGKSIVSVAAHPGISSTGLWKYLSKGMTVLYNIFVKHFFTHDPEKASQPIVMAALYDNVKGGEYYGPTGILEGKGNPGLVKPRKKALDKTTAKRLWDISEKIVNNKFILR